VRPPVTESKRVTTFAPISILHRASKSILAMSVLMSACGPFLGNAWTQPAQWHFQRVFTVGPLFRAFIAQGIQTSVSFGASNTSSAACGTQNQRAMLPMI